MWLSRFDNITRLDACISFVNSIPEIDRMVIGVQNVTELNEIIESLNILPFTSYPDIASSEQALINPSFFGTLNLENNSHNTSKDGLYSFAR